jgi:hypothetical protein
MWYEGKAARLRRELALLDIFDRVHDYCPDQPTDDEQAYFLRQKRRLQVLSEIAKYQVRKSHIEGLRAGSAILLLCRSLYATVHYLFK